MVRNLNAGRVQMDAIGNQAVEGPFRLLRLLAQEPEDARVSVVKGPHGVKQVGDHSRAGREGVQGLFVGGV